MIGWSKLLEFGIFQQLLGFAFFFFFIWKRKYIAPIREVITYISTDVDFFIGFIIMRGTLPLNQRNLTWRVYSKFVSVLCK